MGSTVSLQKNFLYKLGLLGFNSLFPLLVIPYVYRTLNPSVIGLIEYGTTIHNYFLVFGVLGIYTYGLREVSRVRNNKKEVEIVYSNLFCVGVLSNIITLIVFLCYTFFIVGMNSELFIIFLLLGINLISNIVNTEWLFESYENFKFITIKTIVIRLVQFVLIFKLVNDLEDYWIYLLLLVLTTFVNNFVSFIVIKRKISFVWQHLQPKKYLKPLIIIFLLQNSNLLYTQIDRTILGDFIGMESVAFYTVAQKLVTFLYTVLMAITYVSIPRLSFYLSNDYGKYKDGVSKLSRTLFCFILPSSVGLFLLSEEAILVYAGDQYANSIVVLQVFSVRMIFMAIENIYANQILFLHKKENFTVIVYFIIGSINLIVKILLVQVLTPVIAISTTFLLEILLIIILKIYINKRIKARFQIFSMHSLKYFILSLCFFPLIEFCRKTLGFENIVSIICTVCVCILFYIGSLILLKDELVYSTFLKLKKNIGFN